MESAALVAFVSAFSLVLLIFLNPLLIWALCVFRRPLPVGTDPAHRPSVDFVIVVRNGEAVIEKKLRDTLALRYPRESFQVLVYSDGSADDTAARAASVSGGSVRVIAASRHEGKNASLNRAVKECRGELLVFSDVDAEVDPGALERLAAHFADPRIGGVSGNKVVPGRVGRLGGPQRIYNAFAAAIKRLESRSGTVTTNDGTLYAIRRSLYRPLPTAVTDDLFVCLSVITQGYRFLFEPEATARVSAPSKSIAHEVERRRRIVSNSLKGLFLMREVLNVARYGTAALSLLCNKVLRRVLPALLVLLLFSSATLATAHPAMALFFAAQLLFYGMAALYLARGVGGRAGATAAFFLAGNVGTLLGLADYLRGREIVKWDPR